MSKDDVGPKIWAMVLGILVCSKVACLGQASPAIGFWQFEVNEDGAQVLMAHPFHKIPHVSATLTNISGDVVTLSETPATPIIPGAAFLEALDGTNLGMTLRVVGVNGLDIQLERPIEGLLEVGQSCDAVPDWTLGELFSDIPVGSLVSGSDPDSSDLITFLDPGTQTTRVFYLKSGEGWRQVGAEGLGDQSGVILPFTQSFLLLRRSAAPLTIRFFGRVPVFEQRIQPIWSGRNLISLFLLDVTNSPSDHFVNVPPFGVQEASSIVDADSFALSDGSRYSSRFYYRSNHGWQRTGTDNAPTDLYVGKVAADFFRNGPDGFIKTVAKPSPASLVARLNRSQPVDHPQSVEYAMNANQNSLTFTWIPEPEQSYHLQNRDGSSWEDLGDAITGGSATLTMTGQSGQFRVIRREETTSK